ncbi:MAG TPA: UbiA family prenyltransferase [Candidatus Saccharimonadales bacterium]|nr:UbiA family prenyltransferase [Candidatus Saccharimonadales bacterium]
MGFPKTFSEVKSTANLYLDLARPYNALPALLSFAIGYYFYKPPSAWFDFLIGFTVVALLHSAFTMQNDLYDMDVDKANKRQTPLMNGLIPVASLRQVIINLFFVSLVISWFSSNKLYCLIFVLAYAGIAWAYNSRPFSGSRRPIISILLLGLFYTLLPLSFGLALGNNNPTTGFVVFCLLMTVIRFSISILKDFKDATGDRKHRKRTFYLAFGRKPTIVVSNLLGWIGYSLVSLMLARRFFGKLPLALIYLIIFVAIVNIINRTSLFRTSNEKTLTRIFQKSFTAESYFEAMILVCLISL